MGRGRPVDGGKRIGSCAGSKDAKLRAETVVSYLARELSAEEACERLGVGVSRFHEIVSESLQGMVEANERKPAGRPSTQTKEALEVARLEKEVAKLEREVELAKLVEESRWVPYHRKRPKKT